MQIRFSGTIFYDASKLRHSEADPLTFISGISKLGSNERDMVPRDRRQEAHGFKILYYDPASPEDMNFRRQDMVRAERCGVPFREVSEPKLDLNVALEMARLFRVNLGQPRDNSHIS